MISEIAKPVIQEMELPVGWLSPTGELVRRIVVREMSGDGEDILAAENRSAVWKLDALTADCVVSIGDVEDRASVRRMVKELVLLDRTWLIVAMRRVTNSEVYSFKTKCPYCELEQDKKVALGTLTVNLPTDPKVRKYNVKTPRGMEVVMRIMDGEGERILEETKDKKIEKPTRALAARVLSVNGQTPDSLDELLGFLKKLPTRERQYLREEFTKNEGDLDTSVIVKCKGTECGKEWKLLIDIEGDFADFFFRMET